MSRHEHTLTLCALYRGVTPVKFNDDCDGLSAADAATNQLRDNGFLISGDLVIITQGDIMALVGSTNTCRILRVQ